MTLYSPSGRIVGEELLYFQKVSRQGRELGLQVIVFTPEDVDGSHRRVLARIFSPETGVWRKEWRPLPPLIYDRCRYQASAKFQKFKQFRAKYANLIYLNRPLANKWAIHQVLSRSSRIRPHLPSTRRYSSVDLLHMLRARSLLYLKPINGTGGRGVLRLEKRRGSNIVLLQGRDRQRRVITPQQVNEAVLPSRLAVLGVDERYLIQQGIPLKLKDGRVHDFRLLIQKTGTGEWEVTGCAGRIGARRSVTSNLHGGGAAVPMRKLLGMRFGSERVEAIQKEIYSLSHEIARYLEDHYGKLCELGLDIAVDPQGHPWLIEINPKPAREVFNRIGERDTYAKAIRRPLEYALWLYRQKKSDD